jgi:hypothetical protein
MVKLPSAFTNPDNQFGSCIKLFETLGLVIGFISGKANFNSFPSPQFIEDLILIILFKPS